MNHALTRTLACAAVFLVSLLYLYELVGDIYHPSLDEGIYLEGGERLLEGQVPYRDFFAFTGPVIYWTQAGLERVFGRNMPPLRLSATAALAMMVTVIFALTWRFTDWFYGLAAAIVYLGYTSASTLTIIVNHRWLSAGFGALALWAAVEGANRRGKPAWLWGLAGAAAALAAWTTPPFIILVGVYFLWLALRERQQLLPYCGGVLLVSVPAIAWLLANGALGPMLNNLVWVGARYTKANAVPYAYNPSGRTFAWYDPTLSLYTRTIMAIGLARFYVSPIGGPLLLALYGWLTWRGKLDRPRQVLMLGALATFITVFPRWDMKQMLYVSAPLAVMFAWLAFQLPKLAQPALASFFVFWSIFNYSSATKVVANYSNFPTRAGPQRGDITLLEGYERLEKLIPEGATLFAFPYLPSIGYSLRTRNPIRYTFLQPGMMSKEDEAIALADLEKRPPRFILRQYFPDDQVLNTWPSSDRSTLAMNSIRQFIDRRYRFVDVVQAIYYRVEVMELNP